MTYAEIKALKRNDFIRVRYGSKGTQKARVVEPLGATYLRVEKWRANSKRWTKPVWVDFRNVLEVL
jgi:hypothetical protein